MNLRTILTFGVLILAAVMAAAQLRDLIEDTSLLRPLDYMEYWAAGRATLRGQNPYDGGVLYPLQQEMGTTYDFAFMMWNPPWTLPAAMAIGAMPWRIGQMVWFCLNLVAVLTSAAILWRLYAETRRLTWLGVAVAALFAPTSFLLLLGQISGFMVFGLACFLWAVKRDRFALAGALAALTAVKPHLLVGFAVVLILQSLRGNAVWKSVLAGGVVLVGFGLIPLAWNPDIWSQYREGTGIASTKSHPTLHEWEHPTFGYEIRQLIPKKPFAAMFIPMAIAVPSVIVYWWVRRREWDWLIELPRLVFVSLLTAPYGAWGYDLVLLVVPVVQATAWLVADGRRSVWLGVGLAYLVLNLWALSTTTKESSMTNLWIVPVTLAGYVLIGCLTKTSPELLPSPQVWHGNSEENVGNGNSGQN